MTLQGFLTLVGGAGVPHLQGRKGPQFVQFTKIFHWHQKAPELQVYNMKHECVSALP